jgi:hypothetical protein
MPILGPHAFLASAYALKGAAERAAAELAEARRLSGDDRYSSIPRLRATEDWGVPKIQALHETKPPFSPACARPGCRRNERLSAQMRVTGGTDPE